MVGFLLVFCCCLFLSGVGKKNACFKYIIPCAWVKKVRCAMECAAGHYSPTPQNPIWGHPLSHTFQTGENTGVPGLCASLTHFFSCTK